MSDIVTQTVGPSSLVVVGEGITVPVVSVGMQGPAGAVGLTGPTGATGATGEQGIPGVAQVYTHQQNIASATWTIVHNLGAYLPVTVVDSSGEMVEGDVDYVDINTVILYFGAPFGGTAYVG